MNGFTSDDWLTPPEIIEALGPFDLDPATPPQMPWPTAARRFTAADDGLVQQWSGRVWLNPPFSKVNGESQMEKWMARIAAHRNGIALTNARTQTGWAFQYIWEQAHAVFFFRGKLRFYRPNGRIGEQGMNATMLAAYSDADAHAIAQATANRKLDGKFVPLIVTFQAELRTTWRQLIRWLLKECGGVATVEQLYALASGHPKLAQNPNWKAKIRQQVQREARRVGPALWQLRFQHF